MCDKYCCISSLGNHSFLMLAIVLHCLTCPPVSSVYRYLSIYYLLVFVCFITSPSFCLSVSLSLSRLLKAHDAKEKQRYKNMFSPSSSSSDNNNDNNNNNNNTYNKEEKEEGEQEMSTLEDQEQEQQVQQHDVKEEEDEESHATKLQKMIEKEFNGK